MFSSVPLLDELLEQNTFSCGTIRSDRLHYPQILKPDNQMKHGEFDGVLFDDLSVVK